MKMLKLIIVFSILTAVLLPADSLAQSQKVTVGATVLEHLTYLRETNKLTVSTNYQSGFFVINHEDIKQFFQPTEQIITLLDFPFFLVVNF